MYVVNRFGAEPHAAVVLRRSPETRRLDVFPAQPELSPFQSRESYRKKIDTAISGTNFSMAAFYAFQPEFQAPAARPRQPGGREATTSPSDDRRGRRAPLTTRL